MDAKVREKAYQDILNMDLAMLHETLGSSIQTEKDVEILAYIAEILMERDSKSGMNYILPLLHSTEAPLRLHVCGLLSNYSDSRCVEPLVDRLQTDVSADVRVIAAFALGKIQDERALPALRLAQAQDFDVDFEGTSVSKQATDAIMAIQGI